MLRMEDYKDLLLSKGDTGEFWVELQDNDALVSSPCYVELISYDNDDSDGSNDNLLICIS